jgi:hypothetical protein
VRFVPNNTGDNWNLVRAELSFNEDFFPRSETLGFISETDRIWLGHRPGDVVHLHKHLTRRQANASTRAGPPEANARCHAAWPSARPDPKLPDHVRSPPVPARGLAHDHHPELDHRPSGSFASLRLGFGR